MQRKKIEITVPLYVATPAKTMSTRSSLEVLMFALFAKLFHESIEVTVWMV